MLLEGENPGCRGHPPAVGGSVLATGVPRQRGAQLEEFYAGYDVVEGDGMWLPAEDRVRIW